MSNHDHLSRLLNIEDRARRRVQEAEAKAQQIVAEAREEAEQRVKQARTEAEAEANALREKARAEAEQQAQKLIGGEQADIEATAKQAEQHMNDAVEFLMAWVTAREI